jgi:DNA-binding transcriptional regulator YiaG
MDKLRKARHTPKQKQREEQDTQRMQAIDEAIAQLYIARDNIDVQITKLLSACINRSLTSEDKAAITVSLREQGWTQQNIASYLGVTQTTICNWLQAKSGGDRGSEQSIVD